MKKEKIIRVRITADVAEKLKQGVNGVYGNLYKKILNNIKWKKIVVNSKS
jgi:hypothetical protein